MSQCSITLDNQCCSVHAGEEQPVHTAAQRRHNSRRAISPIQWEKKGAGGAETGTREDSNEDGERRSSSPTAHNQCVCAFSIQASFVDLLPN